MRRLLERLIPRRGSAVALGFAILLIGLTVGGVLASIGTQMEAPKKDHSGFDGTPFEEPEYVPDDPEDGEEDPVFVTVPDVNPREDDEVESGEAGGRRSDSKSIGFDRVWKIWTWIVSARKFFF